jgi:hypothetical protein
MENVCSSSVLWPLEPENFCLTLLKMLGMSDICRLRMCCVTGGVWVILFRLRAIYAVLLRTCTAYDVQVTRSGEQEMMS